jgi:hypothetical protein
MNQISLTSGELIDLISLLEEASIQADENQDPLLATYYYRMEQQFQSILESVQTRQSEQRVAHLILAA